MGFIRWLLGSIILFFDWVFTPKGIKRDAAVQQQVDRETEGLTLYQYPACPFCVKVRRALKRNTLHIRTKDVKRSEESRNELLEGGGKIKVPCLKIDEKDQGVRWMYESSDIISYLESRLAARGFI